MIEFSEKTGIFSLYTGTLAYIMQLFRGKYLLHLHWGPYIELAERSRYVPFDERVNMVHADPGDKSYFIEDLPFEYGFRGNGDFRAPSAMIVDQINAPVLDFIYDSYTIQEGKPPLPGLPSTITMGKDDTETLEIRFVSKSTGVHLCLVYTLYPAFNVITRSVKVENTGKATVRLEKLMSAAVDFAPGEYDLLTLPGSWARERGIERAPLRTGITSVGSTRGMSSHQYNPFAALVRNDTTENNGEVYGINLVYSGNFLGEVEKNQDERIRVHMGIEPSTFSWNLASGDSFCSPEAVLVYSGAGLNGLSGVFHKFYTERLSSSAFRTQERPILINNWEATYFDFDEKKLLALAEKSRDAGIELFVLDDGWFGSRNSDTTSLGDWFVNKEKLPGGIEGLSSKIRSMGMKFGLWFEPEMVSAESVLYKEHPDWILRVPNRSPAEGRNQLVLDLCRDEVVSFLLERVSSILATGSVDYVKWDMNRSLTDVYSSSLEPGEQGGVYHRYILGLYRLMETLTERFPDVLFEGCAAGGGRFDPGILHYMPQYWTSDNTDAVSRLKIQYGTSIVYPPLFMGSHVSASPNHQTGRNTSLEIRSHSAMMGNLGYELDLTVLSKEEFDQIRQQISFYKKHRRLIQFGRFYRLESPFSGNSAAWITVGENKKEFLFFYYHILSEVNKSRSSIRFTGLDERKRYQDTNTLEIYTGSELMHRGYYLPLFQGDFQSILVYFTEAEQ